MLLAMSVLGQNCSHTSAHVASELNIPKSALCIHLQGGQAALPHANKAGIPATTDSVEASCSHDRR